jgi:hypothetical protein
MGFDITPDDKPKEDEPKKTGEDAIEKVEREKLHISISKPIGDKLRRLSASMGLPKSLIISLAIDEFDKIKKAENESK